MKIKLATSMFIEDWKSSFFEKGIRFGDIHVGCEHPLSGRILVQAAKYPFPYITDKFLVVEFEKEKGEIHWDPDIWSSEPTPKERGISWYGHYVRRVQPEEILKVYAVEGRLEADRRRKKGDQKCLTLYTLNGVRVW